MRPKSGQVYEVLPRLGSRLVTEEVAGCDSLQVDSVRKRKAQNTHYKTHNLKMNTEQRWEEQKKEEGGASRCVVRA